MVVITAALVFILVVALLLILIIHIIIIGVTGAVLCLAFNLHSLAGSVLLSPV
jgi:hypothetical protein